MRQNINNTNLWRALLLTLIRKQETGSNLTELADRFSEKYPTMTVIVDTPYSKMLDEVNTWFRNSYTVYVIREVARFILQNKGGQVPRLVKDVRGVPYMSDQRCRAFYSALSIG